MEKAFIILNLKYGDDCPYDGLELLEVTIPDGAKPELVAEKAEDAIERAKKSFAEKIDYYLGDSGKLMFDEIHSELEKAGIQFKFESFYDFSIDCFG